VRARGSTARAGATSQGAPVTDAIRLIEDRAVEAVFKVLHEEGVMVVDHVDQRLLVRPGIYDMVVFKARLDKALGRT
jgi:hypothetical protein